MAFGVPIKAHGEEIADLVAPGEESTIAWYIDDDGFDRIRLGLACSNCLEPFPAPVGLANTSVWRDHAHHYSGIRTKDELLSLVAKNLCPVCQSENSNEMTGATHKGRDPHEPERIEVPE